MAKVWMSIASLCVRVRERHHPAVSARGQPHQIFHIAGVVRQQLRGHASRARFVLVVVPRRYTKPTIKFGFVVVLLVARVRIVRAPIVAVTPTVVVVVVAVTPVPGRVRGRRAARNWDHVEAALTTAATSRESSQRGARERGSARTHTHTPGRRTPGRTSIGARSHGR